MSKMTAMVQSMAPTIQFEPRFDQALLPLTIFRKESAR
jgi:hypothetical protein